MAADTVLTIREVAGLLKIGEKTAYSMAKRRALPGFKVGGQWPFRRGDIDRQVAVSAPDAHLPVRGRAASG